MASTIEHDGDVAAFIATAAGPARFADAEALVAMMEAITGELPKLWGSSIVGFGRYHYRYDSGREGDSCLIGFSPRASEFSIYLTGIYFEDSKAHANALLARLGKHRIGKACLYVKRLADIDPGVLEQLCRFSVDQLQVHYG